MPETCAIDPILETNHQKMEKASLETEICNRGELEKQENHMDMEKLTSQNCMEEVCTIVTTGAQLSKKETKLYTDKSITEFMLPELVCFKESSDHVVKDICVDEGVPCPDKVLVEDSATFQESLAGCLCSDKGDYNDVSKVAGSLNYFDGKLATEDKLAMDERCDSTVKEDGISSDERNRTGDVISEATPEALLTIQESETENVLSDLISNGGNGEKQLSTEATNDEENLTASVEPSFEDESCTQSSDTNENPTDHQTALEFSLPETSGREKGTENTDTQEHPRQSFNMPLLEDDELFDSLTGSTRSLFIQHGLGESSFSGVRSVSGPIAYSGQIPYSGSISLRSDSSTGSTRSFAFPVLHSEWNSSPVKMAKADRRRFRKHRGWRVAFLCCKF